jgi:hypothetical protein
MAGKHIRYRNQYRYDLCTALQGPVGQSGTSSKSRYIDSERAMYRGHG